MLDKDPWELSQSSPHTATFSGLYANPPVVISLQPEEPLSHMHNLLDVQELQVDSSDSVHSVPPPPLVPPPLVPPPLVPPPLVPPPLVPPPLVPLLTQALEAATCGWFMAGKGCGSDERRGLGWVPAASVARTVLQLEDPHTKTFW